MRKKIYGIALAALTLMGIPSHGVAQEHLAVSEALAAAEVAVAHAGYALNRSQRTSLRTQEVLARAEHAVARAARSGSVEAARSAPLDATPRVPWLQQDPGDALYRSGREALNQRRYREAAEAFGQLTDEYPESGYAADAYYYQAFALYRSGRPSELEEALAALEYLNEQYPDAANRGDAERLRVRIEGAMAQRGDAASARRLVDQASGPCTGEDYEIRAMALSALMNMDSEKAVPILREVLQSSDECGELRVQAVFLLSQHVTDETVEILLDLAHRNPDPDPEVRAQAVFWLSQVDRPEAIDALESILRSSSDPELQERALFALSQHGDERATGILREYAERGDAPEEQRAKAIFWLSQNEALGLDYLIGLWPTVQSPELREGILFGVSQSDDERAGAWLIERAQDTSLDMELRKNALFWAAQRDVSVAELRSLYETMPDREMREQVLFGLSQMDSPEAVDALMEIARNDPDPELRENAVFWLGQSEDPRVGDFLLELIRR
jgi:HEAT repeat protein